MCALIGLLCLIDIVSANSKVDHSFLDKVLINKIMLNYLEGYSLDQIKMTE